MKRTLRALIFPAVIAAAQPMPQRQAPAQPGKTAPGHAFVIKLRPVLTFVPKGFGQVTEVVPVQINSGRTVNSFIALNPQSAILFTPSLLLGARFGENRHWEAVAGPNATRGIHSFTGGQSGGAIAEAGAAWELGVSAELTRMIGDYWGLFAHYDLIRYQWAIEGASVPAASQSAYTQQVNEILFGPKFRFGRLEIFGGIGPAFIRSPQPAGLSAFHASAVMGMAGVAYEIR